MVAELAVRLPIFLASPNELVAEGQIVQDEIRALTREASAARLLLDCFRWETGVHPSVAAPQDVITKHLKRSELVIVMFGSRIGSPIHADSPLAASEFELMSAIEGVNAGSIDDMFLYFLRNPVGDTEQVRRVRDLKARLETEKQVFFWEYDDAEDLRKHVKDHLRKWLARWRDVPRICEYALMNNPPVVPDDAKMGEARLQQIRIEWEDDRYAALTHGLGRIAVRLYQRGSQHGEAPIESAWLEEADPAWRHQLVPDDEDYRLRYKAAELFGRTAPSPKPLMIGADGKPRFSDPEWFYYFCAIGVIDAIRARNTAPVALRPYHNHIHQFIQALGTPLRAELTPVLRGWLVNRDGATTNLPVVRNFAAYVLGRLGDRSAQDDLADAAENDRSEDVRRYAIYSLGRLRSRRHLSTLIALFNHPANRTLHGDLAAAVCNVIGLMPYEF